MRELERVLGKKTVEDEIFAEAAKHAHEEKRVPGAPAARRQFPMNAAARTLGVARSDLERGFKNVDGLPQSVELLSDNGSCYPCAETIAFAKRLGLINCLTRVRSPESNGTAEPSVRAFKRDYVYVHERPYAKTVMVRLEQWFENYNEYHSQKGLKMKSPR